MREIARQTEVRDLQQTIPCHEDVASCQVTVNNLSRSKQEWGVYVMTETMQIVRFFSDEEHLLYLIQSD